MQALSELGVSPQELRILQQASTAGMGNLKPTDPFEGVNPARLL
jgi:hypothetical protein